MTSGILLAVFGPLEPALVRALDQYRDQVRVQRRCSDHAEVLAAAHAGVGAIAVIDAASGRVDAEFVRQLQASGLCVMLLSHHDDLERIGSLGADKVMADTTAPEVIATAIVQLVCGERQYHREMPPPPAQVPVETTTVIAITGPPGSTGRTTVAITLAHALAELGPTLLIDADMCAPSIDVRLGILDDISGLATIARRANQGRLNQEVLRAAVRTRGAIDILTGIGSATRWAEIPPATIEPLIYTAGRSYRFVIFDTEATPWPAAERYDPFAPHVGELRTAIIAAAGRVLHIARADADGMHRLLLYLHEHELTARDHLVVTAVQPAANAPASPAAVMEVLQRFSRATRASLIRADQRSCEMALLHGSPLGEVAPRSVATTDLRKLACQLADVRYRAHHRPLRWDVRNLMVRARATLGEMFTRPQPPARHVTVSPAEVESSTIDGDGAVRLPQPPRFDQR
ncbi:MAG: hypothetical protein Q4Q03_00645 [Bowdeniella nasicola]|nr:hypothetical protein [Bowdeniella nasicola]